MGYPGKRRSKTDKAIAEAERLAGLLASANGDGAGADLPPEYLKNPCLAGALAVWREHAPRLEKLNLLAPLDRSNFALFCIYAAEFVAANEDVLVNGYSSRVKTVSGGYMPRENPSVARRDFAGKMMLDLSAKFGLSPQDRNRLMYQGMRFDSDTLFGAGRGRDQVPAEPSAEQLEQPAVAPAVPIANDAAIGSLSAFDSVPPGVKPN